jgi:hypothetical protein
VAKSKTRLFLNVDVLNCEHKDRLIARLKEIIQTSRHATGEPIWQHQRSVTPVTMEELAQAEEQLGFALPALLRRIYLEVGNGGFGPGYGLFALCQKVWL